MKKVHLLLHSFINLFFLTLLLLYSSAVSAKNVYCWVDFYADAPFKGKQFRVTGPDKLKNLLNINGENWDKRIESIKVGPKATLTVFENKNFKLTLTEMANHPILMKSLGITTRDILEESEIIFRANTKIHSFGDYHFYHKIRSLKVDCVK
ncbi:MAG: hypothetical protein HFP81_06965 [Methylococcales symbiont of Hymedesmia sp. n. MRB-2018]|nr:MAG: hypothetical protein HFP78_05590 [Methylococcales symbiont of Hymedesmia sp. n. MRB-2018]KAF3983538.1 MAG: hypothetical protein HFP81_06965 [Methylococcales symbiont of Hymedesmia sp. n. MRB-2018]